MVLLVERWVAAQGADVTEADKARVRGLLRLVNCSTSYLYDVLPKLPWLGPDAAQQAAFLTRCRQTDRSEWEHMSEQLGEYDMSNPWYGTPRPQSVPEEGVSYRWEVSREELLAGLRREGDIKIVKAALQQHGHNGRAHSQSVTALGYDWELEVERGQGGSHADLFVCCFIPTAIEAQTGELTGAVRISCTVQAPAGASGTAERVFTNAYMRYGTARGWSSCLPLLNGAGQAAAQEGQEEGGADLDTELLAPWADLLGPEGKIRGTLTFHRPGL